MLVVKLAAVITAYFPVMLFSVTGIRILTVSETIHFLIFRSVVDRKGGKVGRRLSGAGGVVSVGCGREGVGGMRIRGSVAVIVHCSCLSLEMRRLGPLL